MSEHYYYGHGKLLLSGEYFVMDGAHALALPTTVGQSMRVKYRPSYQPTLNWKSFDHSGKVWFESDYEFWHFRPVKVQEGNPTQEVLSQVLNAVRIMNPHFLRDDVDVMVETKIEFPLEWGLGSSSTFIYNIAQWAYVSPFELLKKTIGGSGYDIACAQAMGPIVYRKFEGKPQWETASFNPQFRDHLYFLYMGQKQNSAKEVLKYKERMIPGKEKIIDDISLLTREMMAARELGSFNRIVRTHEDIISKALGFEKIRDKYFSDYWGEVKSLGAWGGDFALVTSDRDPSETREYFENKGFRPIIPFGEIVRT